MSPETDEKKLEEALKSAEIKDEVLDEVSGGGGGSPPTGGPPITK
jgi:hypothetical protein